MAAKPNDFSFSKPLVRSVSRDAFKRIVQAGNSRAKPTDALIALMRGSDKK